MQWAPTSLMNCTFPSTETVVNITHSSMNTVDWFTWTSAFYINTYLGLITVFCFSVPLCLYPYFYLKKVYK